MKTLFLVRRGLFKQELNDKTARSGLFETIEQQAPVPIEKGNLQYAAEGITLYKLPTLSAG